MEGSGFFGTTKPDPIKIQKDALPFFAQMVMTQPEMQNVFVQLIENMKQDKDQRQKDTFVQRWDALTSVVQSNLGKSKPTASSVPRPVNAMPSSVPGETKVAEEFVSLINNPKFIEDFTLEMKYAPNQTRQFVMSYISQIQQIASQIKSKKTGGKKYKFTAGGDLGRSFMQIVEHPDFGKQMRELLSKMSTIEIDSMNTTLNTIRTSAVIPYLQRGLGNRKTKRNTLKKHM